MSYNHTKYTHLAKPTWSYKTQAEVTGKGPFRYNENIETQYTFLRRHKEKTHSLTARSYNPCRVLVDSRSRFQPSQSLALLFQFLTPNLSASLITTSIHLRFGLLTRLLPSGLSKVIFLHGRLSCICTICPISW